MRALHTLSAESFVSFSCLKCFVKLPFLKTCMNGCTYIRAERAIANSFALQVLSARVLLQAVNSGLYIVFCVKQRD